MGPLRCSFCDKTQNQVDKLIAGPEVRICNECVDLCRAILDEDPVPAPPPNDTKPAPPPNDTKPGATATRIPADVVESANRIGRAQRRLAAGLGREPTTGEIAEDTGIEPSEVISIKARIGKLS